MQQLLAQDPLLTDLASLDVVNVDLEGQVLPNWHFFDEVLYIAAEKRWGFRDAAWAVIASRARRAGVRDQVDVDRLAEALSRFLPWTMRVREHPPGQV